MKTSIILFFILTAVGFAKESSFSQSNNHKVYFEKNFNREVTTLLSNSIEYKQYMYAVGTKAIGRYSNYDTDKPFIIKFNQKGNIVWSKTLNNHFGTFKSIVIDENSNIYAVGSDYSPTMVGFTNDIKKALIVKFNDNGEILWKKTIGTTNYDSFSDIKIIDNNLYIIGLTLSNRRKTQSKLVKMNLNGKILKNKILYDEHNIFFEQYIAVGKDNNIYISNNIKSKKPSIAKYDTNFKEIFTKKINTFGLLQIAIDNHNNLYTVSIDKKPILANNIIKLDSDGNTLWEKNIPIKKRNIPIKITINKGTIYILGKYITIYNTDGLFKSEIKIKQANIRNIMPTKDKALLIVGGKGNISVSNSGYFAKIK